ncbi:MAG: peptidoglycan recognition protein family protein [Gammaproteobacteria bacterium]|nr:peptidoglycan recognition protein family protein [Gammaproteobacteria bacterium]
MIIKKLVVHHSASAKETTKKSDIDTWHKQRGFSQIGYHKVVESNGKIVSGRSEKHQGAHAKGTNHNSLGVCIVGNFEHETPSAVQIKSVVKVLVEWCEKYKLTSRNIYGHTSVPGATTKTSCPGKNLISQLPSIKRKVSKILKKP